MLTKGVYTEALYMLVGCRFSQRKEVGAAAEPKKGHDNSCSQVTVQRVSALTMCRATTTQARSPIFPIESWYHEPHATLVTLAANT
jgi:hypothetical protein